MQSSVPLLLLALALACAHPARADEGEGVTDWRVVARDGLPGAGSNDAPRFIRNDVPGEPRRSLPGYRSETTELGYRWWLSRGRADLGLGLGALSYGTRPTGSIAGLGPDAAFTPVASGTVMTLGMRYRTSERSAVYADAAGVRMPGLDGGDGVIGKVGIEFKAARSQFDIAYGGLGMRLAGDTRMTLKLRRGGLGVYMRQTF